MPRDLPRHAFCAPPGIAKSHKTLDGLLGLFLTNLLAGTGSAIATVAFSIIFGLIIPMMLLGPCLGIAPLVVALTSMLQDAKRWYYRERLLCVRDEDTCAVGSVLHEPGVSTDGDRKLDLLLAPYTTAECYRLLCEHLNNNQGLMAAASSFDDPPFFNGTVPASYTPCDPDILDDPNATAADRRQERDRLSNYLGAIQGDDPEDGDATANLFNNLLVGWMDRLLDPSNVNDAGEPKGFQGHLYRKNAVLLNEGSPLWDAIPTDYDPATPWQTPDGSLALNVSYSNPYETKHNPRGINPMFRFDRDRLLPFLHCELDGNYLQLLFDELSLAVVSFGVAYGFACMILGPVLGALIGAILAALLFFLQRWLDGGSDRGQAEPVDVEFDDPGNFGEDEPSLDGDLVALHGPWIMDTEHAQYFEIHPVKAYYVLGRNGRGEIEEFDTTSDQQASGTERLHNGVVTRAMVDEICGNVRPAEEDDPPPVVERRASEVLSYGLTTLYGGGGFAEAPR